MRVLTDDQGYVTLRLSEFPNTAFEIETEPRNDEFGITGSVTLVEVDPADDPLREEPSAAFADAMGKLEALAVQLHGEETARAIFACNQRSRMRDIAVAEQAARARAEAVSRKFGADAGRNDVPKAG